MNCLKIDNFGQNCSNFFSNSTYTRVDLYVSINGTLSTISTDLFNIWNCFIHSLVFKLNPKQYWKEWWPKIIPIWFILKSSVNKNNNKKTNNKIHYSIHSMFLMSLGMLLPANSILIFWIFLISRSSGFSSLMVNMPSGAGL